MTGVVGAIVLLPLLPLKFDLNESGGDPDAGSVCVFLLYIIGPELTLNTSYIFKKSKVIPGPGHRVWACSKFYPVESQEVELVLAVTEPAVGVVPPEE